MRANSDHVLSHGDQIGVQLDSMPAAVAGAAPPANVFILPNTSSILLRPLVEHDARMMRRSSVERGTVRVFCATVSKHSECR